VSKKVFRRGGGGQHRLEGARCREEKERLGFEIRGGKRPRTLLQIEAGRTNRHGGKRTQGAARVLRTVERGSDSQAQDRNRNCRDKKERKTGGVDDEKAIFAT